MKKWLKQAILGFLFLTVGAIFSITEALAIPTTAFSTNFNAGAPAEFSGVTSTESVQGFTTVGFDGLFLRNTSTGNPAAKTTLALTGLSAHDSIDLNFLLAIIDSWDGNSGIGCCNPDTFSVAVDGSTIFSETFTNFTERVQSYSPPAGVQLLPQMPICCGGNVGFSSWNDTAYNMGLDPIFDGITHTASTLTVEWWASGAGWQGGGDESWAIDNLAIVVNTTTAPVPEPSTMLLLGTGLIGLVGYSYKRNKQAT